MNWLKEEENELIILLKEGKNYEEIVNELERSVKSIRCKTLKLGYNLQSFKIQKKLCLCCNKEFEYNCRDKKEIDKKFCDNSCSATFNNKLRGSDVEIICINCKNDIIGTRKSGYVGKHRIYCNYKCQREYEKNKRFEKIENGDTSLNTTQYKKYLIEKYGEKCMKCGWSEVNPYSGNIPIELEHKDGNSENNSLDNLELLCPCCHSLTPTYKALNKGNGRHKRRERYKNGKSY